MDKNYDKITDVIKSKNSFFICAHSHPDGDAIGSTLALGLALESLGKKVTMYNQDPVPRSLDFLSSAEKIVSKVPADANYDATIMVDCGQTKRAGRDFPGKDRRGTLICIDHHMSGCDEADVSCLDETAASTGEVVYKIIKNLGVQINKDIATMILTTVIVDTGFFRYSNTTSHAMEMAAELLRLGASTWDISRNMEERVFPQELNLLRASLETVDYQLAGRLAIMILTDQMMRQTGGNVEMAENFINYPRSIDGVHVAAFIREIGKDKYKISLRSKDSIDVAKLASKFGGGGHEHAAGFTLSGKLGAVRQELVKTVEAAFNTGGK